MTQCSHAPGRVITGIVIPRHDIHLLRPFEIIKAFECSHQIRGNRGLLVISSDRRFLQLKILKQTVRIESPVINRNPCKRRPLFPDPLAKSIGQHNLVPVIDRMSPERQIPGPIQSLYRLVLLSEPDAKCLLTILTVTLSAVFIVHMPAHHILMIAIPLCKPSCKFCDKMPVHRTIGTGVMPLPELVEAALVIGPRHLFITLHHPGRKRSCRSSQHNLFSFLCQQIHNIIQFLEIIGFLRRLDPCP